MESGDKPRPRSKPPRSRLAEILDEIDRQIAIGDALEAEDREARRQKGETE